MDGADQLYDALTDRSPWQQGRVFRYERWADEPRLSAAHSVRADGTTEELGSKGTWDLQRGDRVRVETPGGGGWGQPAGAD